MKVYDCDNDDDPCVHVCVILNGLWWDAVASFDCMSSSSTLLLLHKG